MDNISIIFILVMALLTSIIFSLYLIEFKKFMHEVIQLPKSQNKVEPNKLIGSSIYEYIPKEILPKNSFFVVAITSYTCSYCHSALEEFLLENKKYNLPIINILKAESIYEIEEFAKIYGKEIPLMKLPLEFIELWNIKRYPTFYLINQNGEFIQESGSVKQHFNMYSAYLKGGELNAISM
ncbi:TlpA family protein disulfide reductase [Bacillus sp. DJP31]|uniref:TlpA family protein disulfide reductase n=1 Tax=Bacillus sp. DJP31 TaxID=3409789 RepID=UPI003BB73396